MSINHHSDQVLKREQIKAYTIAYSPQLFDSVEPPFLPLDHTTNERNDWQEYWPIRGYLQSHYLDDRCLYGFLSPRFTDKTGLDGDKLIHFLSTVNSDTDVITISPQPDMAALFKNVYLQNDLFDPGFLETTSTFFKTIGINLDPTDCVMDSTHIVFSNYFFAKPKFWRRWLEINEQLFYLCEEQTEFATKIGLLKKTNYRDGIQRKVFLMERIASTILKQERKWKVSNYDTFQCAYSASRLNEFPDDCHTADALKIAWNKTGNLIYLNQFNKIVSKISRKLSNINS